jgi:hypothetical protein
MSDHLPVVMKVVMTTSLLKPEPTNYPTSFTSHNINLTWTNATGQYVPDGYLVRMSSVGFSAISNPVDGIAIPDSPSDKNVPGSRSEVWFGGLNAGTTYYFKIFGYSGSGMVINYKVDGSVPQVSATTTP